MFETFGWCCYTGRSWAECWCLVQGLFVGNGQSYCEFPRPTCCPPFKYASVMKSLNPHTNVVYLFMSKYAFFDRASVKEHSTHHAGSSIRPSEKRHTCFILLYSIFYLLSINSMKKKNMFLHFSTSDCGSRPTGSYWRYKSLKWVTNTFIF